MLSVEAELEPGRFPGRIPAMDKYHSHLKIDGYIDVEDEMCWLQLQDVSESFGHVGHQHPASNIKRCHQHPKIDTNNTAALLD